MRQKRNKIHRLFLRVGSWLIDDEVLQIEALEFFKSLFGFVDQVDPERLSLHYIPKLWFNGCSSLLAIVTKEEVKNTVMGIGSLKAPSPDGFPPYFFKNYWNVVGDDLWHLVKLAFSHGSVDPSLVETVIVLIPKGENPVHLREFRSISLCNVVYKVIMKVLVNRLRPYLANIIGPL